MRTLASETVGLLAKDGYALELLDLPRFEFLYAADASPPTPDDSRIAPLALDALGIILHSSGTSAFPKPIHILGHHLISWGSTLCAYIRVLETPRNAKELPALKITARSMCVALVLAST